MSVMNNDKKQAICIQCHNKPEQVNLLIDMFSQNDFDFYIHVDRKSDIYDKIDKKDNVFFAERYNVKWGQFSQVEASLSMFKMIDCDKYSFIHLISGNDFQIKSSQYIKEFFKENQNEYIQCNKLPENSTWSWGGMDRVMVWHPRWLIHRPTQKMYKFIRVLYREFVMRTHIFMRKNMPVESFYGGSQWFSITGKMLDWILKYVNENPKYIAFFKHGVCVDEIFFQTLAKMSPYADRIVNEHLRYMIWGGISGGPNVLCENDFDKMINSNNVWARKFTDIEVIKKLCKKL